jgi:hypothetical protein
VNRTRHVFGVLSKTLGRRRARALLVHSLCTATSDRLDHYVAEMVASIKVSGDYERALAIVRERGWYETRRDGTPIDDDERLFWSLRDWVEHRAADERECRAGWFEQHERALDWLDRLVEPVVERIRSDRKLTFARAEQQALTAHVRDDRVAALVDRLVGCLIGDLAPPRAPVALTSV